MMQRRLLLAKQILNPADSVLIVTIDEKEYLHLGCLLEEIFPNAKIQMVSTVINPAGVSSENEFYRTDEYLFFLLNSERHLPHHLFCITNGLQLKLRVKINCAGDQLGDKEQMTRELMHQINFFQFF